MNTSCGGPAKGVVFIRSVSAFTIVLGIIMMGIDIAVYNYLSNFKVGAWWSAFFIILTGILGSISTNRGIIIACCVVSIIAVIVGIVGSSLDGAANSFIKQLQACSSPNAPVTLYGNSDYYSQAGLCATNNFATGTTFNCACVTTAAVSSGSGASTTFDYGNCFNFNFQQSDQTDCNNIMDNYSHLLGAATAFDVLALFSVLMLSILTCRSLCCLESKDLADSLVGSSPTTVIVVDSPYNQGGAVYDNPTVYVHQQPVAYGVPVQQQGKQPYQ